MSREFKFRLWHRSLKQMFWFDLTWGTKQSMGAGWLSVLPIGEERGYGHDDKRLLIDPMDCDILQFTGLLDKNKVEIYEGDIVKRLETDWASKSDSDPRTLEQYLDDKAITGQIEYTHSAFDVVRVNIHDDKEYYSMSPGKHGFVKVIGNIYENAELLT